MSDVTDEPVGLGTRRAQGRNPRVTNVAWAVVDEFGGRPAWNRAAVSLDAADAFDRTRGIVRVDTGSEATVERVARALCDHPTLNWHGRWDSGDLDEDVRDQYRVEARAVLLSLSEAQGETR